MAYAANATGTHRASFFLEIQSQFFTAYRLDEMLVNFPNENYDDGEKAIVTAHDIDGNVFEVKKSGRHAFYANDTYEIRKCSQCIAMKKKVEAETVDERWFAINRDYSGEKKDFAWRFK